MDKAEMETIVPHTGPMFILDRLIADDLGRGTLVSEVDVNPAARFFRPDMNGIPVWVGFEYMAQSIAALSGLQGKASGEAPRIGFIMGVRDYDCAVTVFPLGSVLRVEVAQEFRDGPVVSFACRILAGGYHVVGAMVNAIEEDDAVLQQMMGEASNG
jgi:predicted hotdog family 3-hydroxylacyl-ACP dehydratase